METILKSVSQGKSFDGNPSRFPSFGNIGAPYMATLSLPGFTIGLSLWLFSTSLAPNVQTASRERSPQQHQPHVDRFPSSPNESIDASKHEAKKNKKMKKKKKKRKKKKKENKQGETKQPFL